ncbi:hypothetical protein, partial [uncultured Acidaminococcus sp.]|uniref:hypothetical protein n=1 Tax=uncultured Acidaminococcus sp. TaxID=352152 RepID=UPI0029424968
TGHWTKEGSRAAAAFHCMTPAQTRLWLVLASPEETKTSNGLKERQTPIFIRKNPPATGSFHWPETSDR